jgi:hypothetical protein
VPRIRRVGRILGAWRLLGASVEPPAQSRRPLGALHTRGDAAVERHQTIRIFGNADIIDV